MSSRERYTSDVSLPLQDIFNANVSWIRKDPNAGTMRLRESLRRDGMLLPILLRKDFRVIDGARRLFAAKDLGWTDVPVMVTEKWADAIVHFDRAQKLETTGDPAMLRLPMTWTETNDLIQIHLLPRSAHGLAGPLPTGGHARIMADVFGMRPDEVKFMREIFATARSCARISKELGDAARDIIDETERTNGRRYTALSFLRKLADGSATLEEARTFTSSRYLPRGTGRIRLLPKPEPMPTPEPEPPATSRSKRGTGQRYAGEGRITLAAEPTVAQNLLSVLEQLGLSAKNFTELDPRLTPKEAKELAYRMRIAIPNLHTFRRLLEERATPNPNNPEESSQ